MGSRSMKGQTSKAILGGRLQRTLRRNMTDAEQQLWRHLRLRQLGGFKFRRQHPYADYILDFVCLEARLIVEVDGGQHADRASKDQMRSQFLERAGFRVLRFWNHEVMEELESVKEAIFLALQPHPHSGLPPEGEGASSQADEEGR